MNVRGEGPRAGGQGRGIVSCAWRGCVRVAVFGATVLVSAPTAAQPDPSQMSGLPLPDPQLPAGTISVRIVRGQLSNNVPNHPVELYEGDSVVTVNTDADGRARFLTLNPGAEVYAVTELDGQRLESSRFPVPGQGGIRVMLVAAADPSIPAVPAQPGQVIFGGESRIVIELGEETVTVFYALEVTNASSVPVEPSGPIVLDMPPGAQTTTVMPGSPPMATADGSRVTVPGPFQPGVTPLSVAYILPYTSGSLAITQSLPADLEGLLVIVEKWGTMDVASTQIARRAEMTPDGDDGATYIFGAGPRVAAGQPIALEITGLPYHSRLPRTVTLVIAVVILMAGVWGAATPVETDAKTQRRHGLEARREKLFGDLVKTENQHRTGKIGATKHATGRQELFAALERIYRELDEELAPVVLSSTRPIRKSSPVAGQSGTTG